MGPVAANFENDYKRKEKLYERNERQKNPSWREDDGHLCWLSAQPCTGSVGLDADCPGHCRLGLSQAVRSLSWVSEYNTANTDNTAVACLTIIIIDPGVMRNGAICINIQPNPFADISNVENSSVRLSAY